VAGPLAMTKWAIFFHQGGFMQTLSTHEIKNVNGGGFLVGLGVLAISGAELYYGFDTFSARYQAGKLFLGATGVGLILSLGSLSDAFKSGCAFLTVELARNDRLKLSSVSDFASKVIHQVISFGLKSAITADLGQCGVLGKK